MAFKQIHHEIAYLNEWLIKQEQERAELDSENKFLDQRYSDMYSELEAARYELRQAQNEIDWFGAELRMMATELNLLRETLAELGYKAYTSENGLVRTVTRK